MRQWLYQCCNEFGWFQTSGAKHQPFGTKLPLDFYINICRDAFNTTVTSFSIKNKTQETNKIFGGLKTSDYSIYFTHGQLDPWRVVGLQDIEKSTVIPKYAHCKDFGSISTKDSMK